MHTIQQLCASTHATVGVKQRISEHKVLSVPFKTCTHVSFVQQKREFPLKPWLFSTVPVVPACFSSSMHANLNPNSGGTTHFQ